MNPFQSKLQHSDFKTSVVLFRDLIIFFAIISYFTGWVYLNEYLRHFGLYLANLNVPFYYIFVFSYPPLLDVIYRLPDPTWEMVCRLLVSLLVLVVSILICMAAYKVSLMVGHFALALFFLAIIFISFYSAVDTSKNHAGFVLNGGGKCIRFFFNEDIMKSHGDFVPTLLKANEKNHLRLVWRTSEEVYAVNVGSQCGQGTNELVKPTYRIPVSSFLFSEVVGNTSR